MSKTNIPESQSTPESNESFGDLLSQYEQSHSRKSEDGNRQIEATVIAVKDESIFLDIGFKTEGVLPLAAFQSAGETVKVGDNFPVTVKGRNEEGYYEVSRFKERRPTDWTALEKAFSDKATIGGTVTAMIKGGFSVDVGVRAFMPASRSGVRDASEMGNLVGQDIRCRIIKLDTMEEDVVVDRRIVAEEEERETKGRRYAELKDGDTVRGVVRSLADYGAFIDLGGVDGLLHVGEISWSRIDKPGDVLTLGQEIEAKVLKVDTEKQRISLSMKQLQSHPWEASAGKYKAGERVRGVVTRVAEFGAFVELEPGVEGLIHVSEMSWAKKIKRAADILKPGETVDAVILGVNEADRRIALGLKQTLGDPWVEAAQRIKEGSVIEGPVTSITKFGAFVQVAEGIEGMIHVSEISAEKRINHPQDVLKLGQVVSAQVLAVDPEKRQLRLSMKQLVPTGVDEYVTEHKEGDIVTGRVTEVTAEVARVELGEGIFAHCRLTAKQSAVDEAPTSSRADISSLTSMLQNRWQGGSGKGTGKAEALSTGQIRSFRITGLDAAAKKIELDLA